MNGASGHGEAGAVQALQVHGHAGEGHGGVNRQTDSTQRGRRCENLGAVATGGVHQNLSGSDTPRGRQVGDKTRQLIIGNRKNQQFATLSNLLHRQQRHIGKQHRGALLRSLRHRVNTHNSVLAGAQSRTEDGSDPPGGNNSNAQTRRF